MTHYDTPLYNLEIDQQGKSTAGVGGACEWGTMPTQAVIVKDILRQ